MSVLRLEAVSRWYGNVVAVNDVTFEVGPGITGLLGPNGAGKTTLLHMMSGFLAPSAGTVQLDDTATWRHPRLYRSIGFVPEREAVYGFLTALAFESAARHGVRKMIYPIAGCSYPADARSPIGFELGVKDLVVVSKAAPDYPLGHKDHGVAFLMDKRHLWLRSARQRVVMSVRHTIIKGIRDYFDQNGFRLVDSPILTPAACEGTSTLFEVPYFDMGKAFGDPLLGPTTDYGLLKDVGFGLRLGSTRSALGNVLHIDVAFPLDGPRSVDQVQFLVQTKRSF